MTKGRRPMSGNEAIRLIKPWGVFSAGTVFTEMSWAQREILIDRGLAERVEPDKKARKFTLRGKK